MRGSLARRATTRSRPARGVTYLELLATAVILMILASAILPLGRVAQRRHDEIELRRALRTMRRAIDQYKAAVDQGLIGGTDVQLGSEGYPEDLDVLVEGVNQVGAVQHKLKFLRRIPVDPMTGEAEWGKRCYQDEPDSTSWCGDNVWDVYSTSTAKGLDGTPYNTW
jgi:general secretion pathway protein G